MKNYYEILEIDPSIPYGEDGKDIVKKAFRKLAHKYHPDKNDGKESEKFTDINEAYETLYDDIKRRDYDFQTGFNPNTPKVNRPNRGSFNPFNFKTSSFSFIRRVEIPIELTLENIFYGTNIKKNINLEGKKHSFDIRIEPKQLMVHNEQIDDPNGSIIISFVPDLKQTNPQNICSNADQVLIDRHLNANLIFKIPFEMALTGGTHTTNFFNEKITSTIPKCCKHGLSITKDNLNLVSNSETNLIYFYDLPKLNDEKIEQIVKIIQD